MQLKSIHYWTEAFKADFGLTPVVASEIEFYLHGADDATNVSNFWDVLVAACGAAGIRIFKYEKEKGEGQYEAALFPALPALCAENTNHLKSLIAEIANAEKLNADFTAKPFSDQPGSGLHIHVHLQDEQGRNLFVKQDDIISDTLKHSIGGLLHWLPASMYIFAPYKESYLRFVENSNAPLTVSWGANNRTVAIRLPDTLPQHKHIEHRVAGADADPAQVISLILQAMHDGLKRQLPLPAQIYGDASLPMYGLPKLPASLEEALKIKADFTG